MTLLTDYLLAALSAYWAWKLAQSGNTRLTTATGNWVWALAALAAAAFFGGSNHGFPTAPQPLPWVLWKSTQAAIGLAAYFVIRGSALGRLSPSASRAALRLAILQLALYLAWIALHDAFIYSIVDYGIAFAFALAVHLRAAFLRADTAARWIAGGIVVSFIGAAVQATGLAPHPSFNHNDLYHLIQMFATWLIYRGVRASSSRAASAPRRVPKRV